MRQTSWAAGAQNGKRTMSAWRQRVAGSASGSGTMEEDADAEADVAVPVPVPVLALVGVVVAEVVVAVPLSSAADETADSSWPKAPDANSSAAAAGRYRRKRIVLNVGAQRGREGERRGRGVGVWKKEWLRKKISSATLQIGGSQGTADRD